MVGKYMSFGKGLFLEANCELQGVKKSPNLLFDPILVGVSRDGMLPPQKNGGDHNQ